MKMFSNIYKAGVVAAVALSLSSCAKDWLDQQPSNAIDASSAIKTSSDLQTAYIGMYTGFRGSNSFTDYYAQQMFVYGDVRGEDVQYNYAYGSGRASFYYYMEFRTADQFSTSNAVWQSPYVVIGRANQILAVGDLEDADEAAAEIAQYQNEARVLRAYALFDLTRIYGKPYTMDNGASLGVPFSAEVLESTAKPERATVAENYEQVISDLTTAINSGALSTENNQGFIDEWGAKALLTRVYLTKGDYANALSTAEDIIANSPYQLWTRAQYANAWDKANAAHTNEIMFELAINDNTDWLDRSGIQYLYKEDSGASPGYGDLVVTKTFSDLLTADPEDVRNDVLLPAEDDSKSVFGGAAVYLNKMPPYGNDVRYANVPLLRLSEVYLAAAEAALQTGNSSKAADYLNTLLSNRTSDESKLVTASTITLDRISLERRKELVGEGQRYFDALRLGQTITRYTTDADKGWHDVLTNEAKSYDRTSYKAYPAIPQYEINANKNIKQNDGYGN